MAAGRVRRGSARASCPSIQMIGVHATEAGLETAAEFFELFKTPWEPAVPGRRYPALLSDTWEASLDAELVLVYSSREEGIDRAAAIRVAETEGPLDVDWDGRLLPLYGRVALFTGTLGYAFHRVSIAARLPHTADPARRGTARRIRPAW